LRVLITGPRGFIARNLEASLRSVVEVQIQVTTHDRQDKLESLPIKIKEADVIFHLAGVNRPQNPSEFRITNFELTDFICAQMVSSIRETNTQKHLIFASSTQALEDNEYGVSKKQAEQRISLITQEPSGNLSAAIFRLPGVFGRWSRPNYNSVVATFCFNLVHGRVLEIQNRDKVVKLVAVDDVVLPMISSALKPIQGLSYPFIEPVFEISVGRLASLLTDLWLRKDPNFLSDGERHLASKLLDTLHYFELIAASKD
jgi:UDP-2-acetamido-2,6-beta-L-arabino-hexul-4-ose reductase